MKAIYLVQTSGSGDDHDFIIAAFTTDEKLNKYMEKLKAKYPNEYFTVLDYEPVEIDPIEITVM